MKKHNKAKIRWIKHWAGHFNVGYDTLLGLHNTILLKNTFGTDLGRALYIYRNGYSFAYFKETDYQNFGKNIAKKLIKNPDLGKEWAKKFTRATDKNMTFMKSRLNKILTPYEFDKFTQLFDDYSTWHRPIKVVVDYLPPKVLNKLLPIFTKARIHAEPVYEYHEKIIRGMSKKISAKTDYPYEYLLTLTQEEIKKYLLYLILPSKSALAARSKGLVITFNKGKFTLQTGTSVRRLEESLAKSYEEKVLKGSVAYPGKISGTVKIIFDPFKPNDFTIGDILVTGMTRPEFLPIMKKAGGFITDAGGMLSHAAITAREFKKPCIVGTQIATKVLKDGDLIEVNANTGIIRLLKKKA